MDSEPHAPRVGAMIGRYRVEDVLGSGGMGIVVSAEDPQLGRRVAVKILRPERRHAPEELARMLREAQALARLSHPNIVQVFDVGAFEDGIFIAMELVSGRTLGEWLTDGPSWTAIVDVFVEAGRGLAAVHAHGLVHRDFKPGNVMIDADGRVRVADFGLARLDDAGPSTEGGTGEVALESGDGLTATGTVMGTPGYIAPEQIRGQRGDARSDQFSYCVTLFEALLGVKPFGRGGNAKAALKRIAGARYQTPTKSLGTPRRIRKLVERGLAFDPEQRSPSMAALVDGLARARRRRGTRVVAVAAVGVACAAGVVVAGASPQARTCDIEDVAQVWDASAQTEMKAAFEATGLEYASSALSAVSGELDAYARRFGELRSEACEARLRDEADPVDVPCLDSTRHQLAVVVGALRRADPETVTRAQETAQQLPSLQRCETVDGPAADPSSRRALAEARRRLGAANSARIMGELETAAREIAVARAGLERLDDGRLLAEVAWTQGRILLEKGDFAGAEAALVEAREVALRAGEREIAADAASDLLLTVGVKLGRIDDGKRYQELAVREGAFAPTQSATALLASSAFSVQLGQLAEAERDCRKAIAILEEADVPTTEMIGARMNLTTILRRLGKLDEARANQEEVVVLAETTRGASHPASAFARNNLANVLYAQGDLAAAEAEHRRVLEIRERSLPADHVDVAESHNNLAVVLRNGGRPEESRVHNERALEIRTKALGSEHPLTIQASQNLASALLELGRDEEAERRLAVVAEKLVAVVGSQHPELAATRRQLARALLRQGKLDEADAQLLEALSVVKVNFGEEAALYGQLTVDRCALSLARRRFEEAKERCEAGLAVVGASLPVHHPEHVLAVALLAEAELGLGNPSRALVLIDELRPMLEGESALRGAVAGQVLFVLARVSKDRSVGLALAKDAHEAFRTAYRADEAERVAAWMEG